MRYDRACTSLDWHAAYTVAAYVAGAARLPDIDGIAVSSAPPTIGRRTELPLLTIRSALTGDSS